MVNEPQETWADQMYGLLKLLGLTDTTILQLESAPSEKTSLMLAADSAVSLRRIAAALDYIAEHTTEGPSSRKPRNIKWTEVLP